MLPHLLTYSCRETLNDVAKKAGNVGVRQFLILHLPHDEDIEFTLVVPSIRGLFQLHRHPKRDIISEQGDKISEQVVIISEQAAKIGLIWFLERKEWYFMKTRMVKV